MFARRDPDGIDDDRQFGNLWELLAPWEPERLVVGARHSYEIRCELEVDPRELSRSATTAPRSTPSSVASRRPTAGTPFACGGLFVAGPMDLYPDAETMSLDGRSLGVPLRGLSAQQLREVGYFGVFPNLLISPHPDYVLTHRMEPLAPDRTYVECEWLFPPEAFAREGFSPDYAVEFWDVTNRAGLGGVRVAATERRGTGVPPGPPVEGLGGGRLPSGADDRAGVPDRRGDRTSDDARGGRACAAARR